MLLLTQLSTLNPQLRAADLVWTNTAGGNWNTAANWSPNVVPTAADNAWITNNGTYAVALTSTLSVNSFVLGGGSGTQTVNFSGGTFTVADGSWIAPNGQFNQSSGILNGAGNLTNTGTLTWTGGEISGSGQIINAAGATIVPRGDIFVATTQKRISKLRQERHRPVAKDICLNETPSPDDAAPDGAGDLFGIWRFYKDAAPTALASVCSLGDLSFPFGGNPIRGDIFVAVTRRNIQSSVRSGIVRWRKTFA